MTIELYGYSHSNPLVTGPGYQQAAEEVRSASQPWKTAPENRASHV